MPRNMVTTHLNTQVCEGGAMKITIELYDSNRDLATPTALVYSVFDEHEQVVNGQESVVLELAGSQSIWLTGADLVEGLNYFVLRGTYDEVDEFNIPIRAYASFRVSRLPGA